jgi:hypothetical protein
MKLQLVPARQGALWVRQGFAIFLRQPMGFAGLFASFLFGVFALMLVPFAGPALLLALLPLGSLGFMVATRRVLAGRFPLPHAFIEPLRAGRPRLMALVRLGIVYAAATWAILWLSDLFDGGALDALVEAQANSSSAETIASRLADPRLRFGVLLRFGLLGLLSIPFWHAPALVHWGGFPAAKSLFFSTMAVWRNKGAFVVYSLAWFGVLATFALLANLLFAVLGRPDLVPLVAMPASLVFSTVFYASLWFTFADCFRPDDSDAADRPTTLTTPTTGP